MTDDNPMYTATLTQGQTYIYDGRRFDFGVPVVIDESTYRNLKREAVKSVKQSDGNEVRRVDIPMFKFAKAKFVKAAPPLVDDTLDDDDELDEVTVAVDEAGNPITQTDANGVTTDTGAGAADGTGNTGGATGNGQASGAPGADQQGGTRRTRARGAKPA